MNMPNVQRNNGSCVISLHANSENEFYAVLAPQLDPTHAKSIQKSVMVRGDENATEVWNGFLAQLTNNERLRLMYLEIRKPVNPLLAACAISTRHPEPKRPDQTQWKKIITVELRGEAADALVRVKGLKQLWLNPQGGVSDAFVKDTLCPVLAELDDYYQEAGNALSEEQWEMVMNIPRDGARKKKLGCKIFNQLLITNELLERISKHFTVKVQFQSWTKHDTTMKTGPLGDVMHLIQKSIESFTGQSSSTPVEAIRDAVTQFSTLNLGKDLGKGSGEEKEQPKPKST